MYIPKDPHKLAFQMGLTVILVIELFKFAQFILQH